MFGIFGDIINPFLYLSTSTALQNSTNGSGLIALISVLVKVAITIAGIYTLFNFILAGYGFLSAGGDAKLVQKSQERIWRSVIGLIIVVLSILFSMILSYFIFGDYTVIVNPVLHTP